MYKEVYESWQKSNLLTKQEKAELMSISENESEIEYRFAKDLEFGTAGMRGILGLGTNMMNLYTVRRATQGLAEYIIGEGEVACKKGVCISYDTRLNSELFAKATAQVLSANGIKVYLFNDVRPVPMLSFAVRCLGAKAGVMITASHNPKEYNGYKVYGEDGAQMSPEDTAKVVKFISAIESPLSDKIKLTNKKCAKIKIIGKAVDKKYYKKLLKLTLADKKVLKVGWALSPDVL